MIGILIDSSNASLVLGISKDKKIIASVDEPAWQRQSEILVDLLAKLLRENDIKREEISYVVACKGPGSYTGVRIALTVAKVMAFSLNIPLYLLSSLEALKDPNAVSICVSNARSKRSYVGIYRGNETLLADTIWTNEELLAYIRNHPEAKVCGETNYLGLNAEKPGILNNLNDGNSDKNLQKDVLSAKPVYLKDNYPI